jgi:hypothetical protein
MVFVFAVALGLFFLLARAIRQGLLRSGHCHLNEDVT